MKKNLIKLIQENESVYESSISQKEIHAVQFQEKNPIIPKKSEWELVETSAEGGIRKLVRTFTFDKFDNLIRFVEDVIQHQEYSGHKVKNVIEDGNVTIEAWTKHLNDVTTLDENLIKNIDDIYWNILDSQ